MLLTSNSDTSLDSYKGIAVVVDLPLSKVTSTPWPEPNSASTQERFLTEKLIGREDRRVTDTQLADARRHHRSLQAKQPFSRTLVGLDLATDEEIARWLAEHRRWVCIGPGQLRAAPDAVRALPEPIARTRLALAVDCNRSARKITMAVADPEMPQFSQVRHALAGWQIEWAIALYADLEAVVKDTYTPRIEAATENELERFVEEMLREAAHIRGLSDIHIKPEEKNTKVQFRIDGELVPYRTVEKERRDPLVAQLKLATGRGPNGRARAGLNLGVLDVATQQMPQDASTVREWGSKRVSLRFSTLPTLHGESIVIRVLDQTAQAKTLAELGFLPDAAQALRDSVRQPHGMVIAVGATSQGKSTTLAATIKLLSADPNLALFSVEDPIEYWLWGTRQSQVTRDLSFQVAMESILRQDPDVILFGEIRDELTATIAIRAAITGHLVATTLHANSATQGIFRLTELKVAPSVVSGAVSMLFAQCLVRRLCKACRRVHPENQILKKRHAYALGLAETAGIFRSETGRACFYEEVGCPLCNGKGFNGRLVVAEHRAMRRELQEMIHQDKQFFSAWASERIFTQAYSAGDFSARTMREDGIVKAALGWTTIEQVHAATVESLR